jgi:hypothetical protein
MILDSLKDAILQNIGPLKQAPKGWYKRHCMLCHTQGHGKDTRNRFGIQFNSDSIACNCFNCKFTAGYTEGKELSKSMKFFLRQLHVGEEFIKQIEFEIFRAKNKIETTREGQVTEDRESKLKKLFQQWKPMELPQDSMRITEWLEHGLDDPQFLKVVNYALTRRIYDLDQFYWCPDRTHNLNQRLIIPYYYRRNIVGFTSRLCYDTDDKTIPKYYQQCPMDFVYNLDPQQGWARKYVLVNEGVLDAWSVDGISTLGEIGQAKVDIINRLQKQVIVCPDRDKSGGDLVDAAIENNWAVAFPRWPSDIKDAAKASEVYGRLLTTHSIISTAVSGKEKIQLTWDIQQNERRKRK